MKIILWAINYAPESIGIAPFNQELCQHLATRGHEVSAVSAFAYYPRWEKTADDRGRWYRDDVVAGVTVHRCWCHVPAVVTTLRRIAHELSFGASSLLRVLGLPRADIYIVVSPPLGLGFFAWVATRLKRSRFVFHVQDLQPDAAVGLGMIKRGGFTRLLYALERLAYKKAARVSGISDGMLAAFARKGVPVQKRALLPNWLRRPVANTAPMGERAEERRRFGVADGALLAVYAGNLGLKQSLEIVIEAAVLLRARPVPAAPVQLIIAGDGAARAGIEAFLRAHPGVAVRLLPLLDDGDYAALLAAADLALITQSGGSGQYFFPSKLLSVLAAGLPVLAVADADSELALAVRAGGFGGVVRPGDAAGLADALARIAGSRGELAAWASRTDWVSRFDREEILPRFEKWLHEAARISALKLASEAKPASA
jgi:colanic acid biosynthesis glycosyl transferase WcaI